MFGESKKSLKLLLFFDVSVSGKEASGLYTHNKVLLYFVALCWKLAVKDLVTFCLKCSPI